MDFALDLFDYFANYAIWIILLADVAAKRARFKKAEKLLGGKFRSFPRPLKLSRATKYLIYFWLALALLAAISSLAEGEIPFDALPSLILAFSLYENGKTGIFRPLDLLFFSDKGLFFWRLSDKRLGIKPRKLIGKDEIERFSFRESGEEKIIEIKFKSADKPISLSSKKENSLDLERYLENIRLSES